MERKPKLDFERYPSRDALNIIFYWNELKFTPDNSRISESYVTKRSVNSIIIN